MAENEEHILNLLKQTCMFDKKLKIQASWHPNPNVNLIPISITKSTFKLTILHLGINLIIYPLIHFSHPLVGNQN